MLVDSHCHLHMIDYDKLGSSYDDVMHECKDLERLLCVSTTPNDFKYMQELTEPYKNKILLSTGLHPSEEGEVGWQEKIGEYSKIDRVVAIGETGLDFHYDSVLKEEQLLRFSWQVDKARKEQLPLIIHTREAKQETLDVLIDHGKYDVTGVMHCFTEDLDMAKKCLDLGFYISLSGIVTFKNAMQIKEVAKNIPLDMMLVETDSPYLAPIPMRGKTNIPSYVKHTANYIAELRGVDFEDFCRQTTRNFNMLFKVS